MLCPRCKNTDPKYFYKGRRGWYCRKCVRFKRVLISDDLEAPEYNVIPDGELTLTYPLTTYQEAIAKDCISAISEAVILLFAVCGAGKTEVVMPLISTFLKDGKKVCYAIARKEVVLELYERLKSVFKNNSVTKVCGGFTKDLYADLIVCTTHQLYRYPKTFDLLILDEVDAFPFKGDVVLNNIAIGSLKPVTGRILYSTATIDHHIKTLMQHRPLKVLKLNRRPHGHPLPRPKVYLLPRVLLFLVLFRILRSATSQIIIFVESIKMCKLLYRLLVPFFSITFVFANATERNANIRAFKDKKFKFVVATSVLERGITIPGVDVVILKLYDGIFDKASLVQMSGRAGRAFTHPDGGVFILTTSLDKEIRSCLKEIDEANAVYLL